MKTLTKLRWKIAIKETLIAELKALFFVGIIFVGVSLEAYIKDEACTKIFTYPMGDILLFSFFVSFFLLWYSFYVWYHKEKVILFLKKRKDVLQKKKRKGQSVQSDIYYGEKIALIIKTIKKIQDGN